MITIYYHRDFDGMASAAILAEALQTTRKEEDVTWSGVNFDRTLDWRRFGLGERFAVVDFHFHPKAEFWFDHHPTTFLTPEFEKLYHSDDRHCFDPRALSCPPIILQHARDKWGWDPPARFRELCEWSDVIDSARYRSAEHALFGKEPALRINRALTCAPDYDFHDRIVYLMRFHYLNQVAEDEEVDHCFQRAEHNRDSALASFPATVLECTPSALLADLRSKKIRRERFAPFFHHPEIEYAVTVLPTRAGTHITVAANPWNRPQNGIHLGELLKKYGGGGHQGIGGVNPPDDEKAMHWARELFARVAAQAAS